jgi:adenylate kinase family enzyme
VNYDLTRVVVIGTSGSGKTTFAHNLAGILDVPHIELDAIHWLPNWTPRDRDEFRELVGQAVSRGCWIADGNYSAVRDILWPRATTVIWLNYPFGIAFWRVFSRTVKRIIRRDELFSGNRESFRLSFLSRDSLLWWVITTHRRRRMQFRALFDEQAFPNVSLLEFRHPRQAQEFLVSLAAE